MILTMVLVDSWQLFREVEKKYLEAR